MREASSGLLVPAMGLPGEGAGEAACERAGTTGDSSGTEGAETDNTGALATAGVSGTDDTTTEGTGDEVFGSSGVAGLRVSLTLSVATGEAVRVSTRAGVLALLGLALGVLGLARAEGGFGDTAGLVGDARPLGVTGDADLSLDTGLGLDSVLVFIDGMDCLFFSTFSLMMVLFSFSFSLSFSFLSFLIGVESRLRWVISGVLVVTLQRSEQR